jgi:hypothetical protein
MVSLCSQLVNGLLQFISHAVEILLQRSNLIFAFKRRTNGVVALAQLVGDCD